MCYDVLWDWIDRYMLCYEIGLDWMIVYATMDWIG
jgi:hypothetical protein